MATNTIPHLHYLLLVLLLLSPLSHAEKIKVAHHAGPTKQAKASNPASNEPSNDVFGNMQSTFQQAQTQTSSLGSLFDMDSFFSQPVSDAPTTKGNNIVEGSGNQMQGYNNRVGG